jgi:hypothetical protein
VARLLFRMWCVQPVQRVLVVAYYRSGSSLTGQLFNLNPAAMFWFEPLAAVSKKWGWVGDLIPPRNWYHHDNGTEKYTDHLLSVYRVQQKSSPISFLGRFVHEWTCVLLRSALSVCDVRESRPEFWTEYLPVGRILCSIHPTVTVYSNYDPSSNQAHQTG